MDTSCFLGVERRGSWLEVILTKRIVERNHLGRDKRVVSEINWLEQSAMVAILAMALLSSNIKW